MSDPRPRPRTADAARGPAAGREVAALREELARERALLDVLQAQNAVLRQVVTIHDRLSDLVLEGADVAAITTLLGELVARPVLLLDAQLRRVAHAGGGAGEAAWAPHDAYVQRVLETLAGERHPLRIPAMPAWGVPSTCLVAPIVLGEATLGYLALLEDRPVDAAEEDVSLLAAQHAATIYALAMMRQRMAGELSDRLRDELLEGLLLGLVTDEQGASQRATRLGYDPARAYRAVAFAAEEGGGEGLPPRQTAWTQTRRRRLLEEVSDLLQERLPGTISTIRPEGLIALVPEPASETDGTLDAAAQAAIHSVAAFYPAWSLTVGVGGPLTDVTQIPRSYQQALRAVETAARFGKQGEVLHFEQLGLYRLLFHVQDPNELRAFVEQTLGALVAYDRRHQGDLVRTLSRYLANHESLQATARDLAVHVNTVTYRIQRVQAISGLDLEDAEDRLLAQVALKILEGLENPA